MSEEEELVPIFPLQPPNRVGRYQEPKGERVELGLLDLFVSRFEVIPVGGQRFGSESKGRLGLTGRSCAPRLLSDRAKNPGKIIRMSDLDQMINSNGKATFWWALYTRHQHEKTVAQILESKGFEVFLPLYESTRRWKDRNKLLSLPLFPCYVFVRGGLERRLQVLTTPGVHMILYVGDRVAVIAETEIEAIRLAIYGRLRVEPHPFLRCGERVRVTRGSLEGVEGILVRKKSLYRLVLSVEMLAQSVAVEIDAFDVEATKRADAPNAASRGAKSALGHSLGRSLDAVTAPGA